MGAVFEDEPNVAVTVTWVVLVTDQEDTANETPDVPSATFTEAGTTTSELLLWSVTSSPPGPALPDI